MYFAVRSSAPASAPSAMAAAPAAASRYRSSTAAAWRATSSAPRTPATGAASSRRVYSGVGPDAGVRIMLTPWPADSTRTTARSGADVPPWIAAGTRIQSASLAYGTPNFVPVTVADPLWYTTAVVAGTAGIP